MPQPRATTNTAGLFPLLGQNGLILWLSEKGPTRTGWHLSDRWGQQGPSHIESWAQQGSCPGGKCSPFTGCFPRSTTVETQLMAILGLRDGCSPFFYRNTGNNQNAFWQRETCAPGKQVVQLPSLAVPSPVTSAKAAALQGDLE